MKETSFTNEVTLSQGVTATFSGSTITLNGPKGEVSKKVAISGDQIKIENNRIAISSKKATKTEKKIINSIISHIKNMDKGVTQSHKYILKICSGHFPMSVSISGSKLTIKNFLGEKIPRVLEIKQGAKVTVDNDKMYVESASKETAGQVSADIEQLTRRPGFDTRIFMDGIYIINKDGKELK